MSKIICTGNPEFPGIAQALKTVFPDTVFVSRTSGYDLTTARGIKKFKTAIQKFDVFVNCSQVSLGTQEKLLNIVAESWGTKPSHVFNIGSALELTKWSFIDPVTSREKLSLRECSLDLCSSSFKTTHMIVSGFRDKTDSNESRMDPLEIVKAIQWVLNSEVHVPLISVAKVEC